MLERDGPPPPGGANEAFHDWKRTGVGHLRQSHAFLARLRNIIREEHPQLSVRIGADVVVDAGGKGADLIGQLREAGAQIPEFTESAGILYFTRHYRLRPGRLKRPANLLRVLASWARGKRRNACYYPPRPGPARGEMMRALGLDPGADMLAPAA